MRAATTIAGENVRPWRGAVSGRGRTIEGDVSTLPSPFSRRHWRRISSGSRPRYWA